MRVIKKVIGWVTQGARPRRAAAFAALLMFAAVPAAIAPAQTAEKELREAFRKAGLRLLTPARPAADFDLPLAAGGKVRLSALRGKPVFLNFWATWCPPCRSEMPSMEALYQRFKDQGLQFIAVDLQETGEEVTAFMKKAGLTFPAAIDKGSVGGAYAVRSIPSTFIIDSDGLVIAQAVGSRQWDSPAVFAAFEALLGE